MPSDDVKAQRQNTKECERNRNLYWTNQLIRSSNTELVGNTSLQQRTAADR